MRKKNWGSKISLDCPFNPKTNRDLSVLKKLLMLHQTCGLAQPSIGKNFLNWCGNILSPVWKGFVSCFEIFHPWSGIFLFSFLSYHRNEKCRQQRQTISTPETKNFHTSLESFHFCSYPPIGKKKFHTETKYFHNRTEK